MGNFDGNGYKISNFSIDYDAKRTGLKGELKVNTKNTSNYSNLYRKSF